MEVMERPHTAVEPTTYWEYYDDQTSVEFGTLSYVDLTGALIVIPTEDNLKKQVAEILRKNGDDTAIKVFARK